MICEHGWWAITCEFISHWVPHISGLMPKWDQISWINVIWFQVVKKASIFKNVLFKSLGFMLSFSLSCHIQTLLLNSGDFFFFFFFLREICLCHHVWYFMYAFEPTLPLQTVCYTSSCLTVSHCAHFFPWDWFWTGACRFHSDWQAIARDGEENMDERYTQLQEEKGWWKCVGLVIVVNSCHDSLFINIYIYLCMYVCIYKYLQYLYMYFIYFYIIYRYIFTWTHPYPPPIYVLSNM